MELLAKIFTLYEVKSYILGKKVDFNVQIAFLKHSLAGFL